ncbi:MAG TPA: CoA-binding protein [Candidatus Dormibacteraeota bacterium]
MLASVLLVDWPSQDVPRALLGAGFAVLSANLEAGTASAYDVLDPDAPAAPARGLEIIAPDRDGDAPLVIRRLPAMPSRVGVVALFRPEAEHTEITRRAINLRATAIWVQRGRLSGEARRLADRAGIAVIDDVRLADAIPALLAFD